jgi:hypothetical protein
MSATALMTCLTASGIAVWTGSGGILCQRGANLCVCDESSRVTAYCIKAECKANFHDGQKVRNKTRAHLIRLPTRVKAIGQTSMRPTLSLLLEKYSHLRLLS